MRNAPAFVGAILLALFLPSPGSAYFLSGAALIVFGPIALRYAAEGALWIIAAILDTARSSAGRTVARLAAIAALGSAVITGGVSLAYAEPLARPPFFVAVETYLDAATALPDMSEPDRAALRSVLRPIVEAARDGCK